MLDYSKWGKGMRVSHWGGKTGDGRTYYKDGRGDWPGYPYYKVVGRTSAKRMAQKQATRQYREGWESSRATA